VLVDVAKDVQEAEFDFRYPDEVDLPGWKPPTKVHARQLREAAQAIAERERRSSTRRRRAERRRVPRAARARRAAALPAVVTLMGKGCLPDSHPLNYGRPGCTARSTATGR
jgi:acetolactate synthase-1/2/3 large subunit